MDYILRDIDIELRSKVKAKPTLEQCCDTQPGQTCHHSPHEKDHSMEFTVQDNGIGFDPEETIAKRIPWAGLGLLGIKARTELSGEIFGIESAKGKGTTIRASWPL